MTTFAMYHDILRLEIAVENAARLQVLKGRDDARRVEASRLLVESTQRSHPRKQLASHCGISLRTFVRLWPTIDLSIVDLDGRLSAAESAKIGDHQKPQRRKESKWGGVKRAFVQKIRCGTFVFSQTRNGLALVI